MTDWQRMRHIEDDLNKVADDIANEGMTVRASRVRAGAIALAELRLTVEPLMPVYGSKPVEE